MNATKDASKLADLLRRAQGKPDPWPAGARVESTICGGPVRGTVGFVDDGWIYWLADNGDVHASRENALRRVDGVQA